MSRNRDILPAGWRPREVGTLVYLRAAKRVLLIEKKRGHGAGKINAPGGKLEAGETPLQCARREVAEEVGVCCRRLELMATLRFHDRTDAALDMLGYAFCCEQFCGDAVETVEAKPEWFEIDDVPFARMWAGDAHWVPQVLRGIRVAGDLVFAGDVLVDQLITPARRVGS